MHISQTVLEERYRRRPINRARMDTLVVAVVVIMLVMPTKTYLYLSKEQRHPNASNGASSRRESVRTFNGGLSSRLLDVCLLGRSAA